MDTIRANPRLATAARVLALSLTGVVLGIGVAFFVILWSYDSSMGNVGEDYRFYVDLGRRWLETGVMYGERQLTGSQYNVEINVDNLYPPPAILFFVAFVYIPWFVWYLIPLALVAYAVWRAQPAVWTWPFIALCIAWPRTLGSIVVGNSDLWSAAFVAAGLVWSWPSVLGLFKPSFAPFVLIGIRSRSWWIALAVAGLVALLFAGYWPQYLNAATHWDLPVTRSLANIPMLLIPIIAWVGRRRPMRRGQSPASAASMRTVG